MRNSKKIYLIYSLLLSVVFFSCKETANYGIQTLEHEGCEYVIYKDDTRSDVSMVHKQNCKYCEERNKK